MAQARTYLRFAAIGAVALAISGCAEIEFLLDSAKLSDGPYTEQRTLTTKYKVGNPYKINGRWYHPAEDWDYSQNGVASWYGPHFHGKRTASGEIYDQTLMTAAHPTLPMPSMVRVTNLENGRSVDLRINDRGPFVDGRIIDVSRRGAEMLGMIKNGTARVRVDLIEGQSRQLKQAALSGQPYAVADAPAAPAGLSAGGDGEDVVVVQRNKPHPGATLLSKIDVKPLYAPAPTVVWGQGSAEPGESAVALVPFQGDAPRAKPLPTIPQGALTQTAQLRPEDSAPAPVRAVEQAELAAPTPLTAPEDGYPAARPVVPAGATYGDLSPPPPMPAVPPRPAPAVAQQVAPPPPPTTAYRDPNADYVTPAPIARPAPAVAATGSVFVQAGSFSSRANAERHAERLSIVAPARVEPADIGGRTFYRVRVPVNSREDGQILATQIHSAGLGDTAIVSR